MKLEKTSKITYAKLANVQIILSAVIFSLLSLDTIWEIPSLQWKIVYFVIGLSCAFFGILHFTNYYNKKLAQAIAIFSIASFIAAFTLISFALTSTIIRITIGINESFETVLFLVWMIIGFLICWPLFQEDEKQTNKKTISR